MKEITEKSAIQLYQYFRDVCSWRLVHHDPQIVLGGTGQVVSIDESLFCHEVKVNNSYCTMVVNSDQSDCCIGGE